MGCHLGRVAAGTSRGSMPFFRWAGGTADEEWCYRCNEGSSETSFYTFDPVAPVCKLGQVRAWQPASALAEIRKDAEAR